MSIEIERKFLIDYEKVLPCLSEGTRFEQAYFDTRDNSTVRIRIAGCKAYLTIKGITTGISRSEFEYEIPVSDAEQMLEEFCPVRITKKRYLIPVNNHTFEVDIFEGENAGLFLAEVELSSEGEEVLLPDWITTEVTGDPRYYNSKLLNNPYSRW